MLVAMIREWLWMLNTVAKQPSDDVILEDDVNTTLLETDAVSLPMVLLGHENSIKIGHLDPEIWVKCRFWKTIGNNFKKLLYSILMDYKIADKRLIQLQDHIQPSHTTIAHVYENLPVMLKMWKFSDSKKDWQTHWFIFSPTYNTYIRLYHPISRLHQFTLR